MVTTTPEPTPTGGGGISVDDVIVNEEREYIYSTLQWLPLETTKQTEI